MLKFNIHSACFWTALMLAISFGYGQSDNAWEMRVCADPYGYPMSGRDDPGVYNAMADILADALGAEATFEWTHLDSEAVKLTLLAGKCDLIFGMTEGAAGVSNTVPFARVPYVFVSLAERELDISSLDDPQLAELQIGTYRSGIPSIALQNRGIFDNVSELAFVSSPNGADLDTPILEAVASGQIDIGIMYGPPAAGFEDQTGIDLNIVPLAEEIEFAPSMLQFFRTLTIGVRPGDAAFRDSLDVAITERWDEIQQVLADFEIPVLTQIKPAGIPQARENLTAVGLIAPLATGAPIPDEQLGENARFGAQLAEYYIGRAGSDQTVPFQLLLASAPDNASATRAANRLLALNKPDAIIGGFNFDQALALAEAAADHGTPFFNIAVQSDEFRRQTCDLNVFHVEASESQYVAALIDWYGSNLGLRDWHVIHENTEAGTALMEATASQLEAAGLNVAGISPVAEQQFAYMNEIRAIQESQPDVVLLLLPDNEQLLFRSQASGARLVPVVTGLAGPLSQRRDAIFRQTQNDGPDRTFPTALLWEASLADGSAEDINLSYLPRGGEPMAATAWASFAATLMTYEAALEDADNLSDWLRAEETVFDLGKGEGAVFFGPGSGQLQQPMYLVSGVNDADWSRVALRQVDVAELQYVSSGAAAPDFCD